LNPSKENKKKEVLCNTNRKNRKAVLWTAFFVSNFYFPYFFLKLLNNFLKQEAMKLKIVSAFTLATIVAVGCASKTEEEKAEDRLEQTSDELKKHSDEASEEIEDGFDQLKEDVNKAIDKTEKGLNEAAEKTEEGVKKAAKKTEEGVEKAVEKTKKELP
jgi:DNA anti-recombination protein RmuC